MAKGTDSVRPVDQSVLSEIARSAQLVWRLMLDPRVALSSKLIVPGIVLYVLSPLDLIPDAFILMLGLGMVDDLAIIYFGIKLFLHVCPPDVVAEHRRALGYSSPTAKGEYVDGTYRVVDDK
jgi:uncharacterized membrane protein YkvA (DUF1232 family)